MTRTRRGPSRVRFSRYLVILLLIAASWLPVIALVVWHLCNPPQHAAAVFGDPAYGATQEARHA